MCFGVCVCLNMFWCVWAGTVLCGQAINRLTCCGYIPSLMSALTHLSQADTTGHIQCSTLQSPVSLSIYRCPSLAISQSLSFILSLTPFSHSLFPLLLFLPPPPLLSSAFSLPLLFLSLPLPHRQVKTISPTLSFLPNKN